MDIRQVENQLALLLANAVFSDSPGSAILTAVRVTQQDLGAFLADWASAGKFTLPFAVVRVSGERDERDAASHASGSMGLGVRVFMRAQVAIVAGSIVDLIASPPPFATIGNVTGDDVHGQGAMVGKNPVIGTPAGQGVDRLVPEVIRQAFGNGMLIDNIHGIEGRVVSRGDAMEVYGVMVAARRIDIDITNGSTVESYHPADMFKLVVAGSTVTATWQAAPTRPDFLKYQLKRDGVQVYAGPLLTFADTGVASGVHSYTLAALYDDVATPPASANRTSPILTLSATV